MITTRNPLEVAGSLRARDGFSGTKSCLLWLRHLLDAERGSRGFPRVFVSYERLLRDWVGTSEHIARELHLFWPHSGHEAHHEIEEYLSSELRHHSFESADVQARSDVAAWVKQAFEEVSRATADADDVDCDLFDEIRAQLDRADQAYGPLLAQAAAKIWQLDEARVEAEAQAAALATALAERQNALDSLDVDNRLVTERLVEEIETVARLQRLLDELAEVVVGGFGRGLGAAGAALLAAEGETVTLQTAVQEILDELRHRPALEDEPEAVRRAVDETIRQTIEFLLLLDEDRAHLLAESAEHDAREAQGRADRRALEDELSARAEVLSATMERSEAELAQSAAEYQTLRAEAQQLAAALADNETKLADARLEREASLAHAAQAAAALGELEAALADTASRESTLEQTLGEREGELAAALERAEAAESRLRSTSADRDAMRAAREEWLAKSARLQMTVAEQEQALEEVRAENAQLTQSLSAQEERLAETLAEARQLPAALDRAETAEAQLRSTAAELDKAFAESARLTQDLSAQASQLPAALDRAEAAELQLQSTTAELDRALAESARLTKDLDALTGQLPVALDRAEAAELQLHASTAELDRALDERSQLTQNLSAQEERLAQTLAEAGQLAAALADTEDALSQRTAELVERDEQLDVRAAEVAARMSCLRKAQSSTARLAAELQVRDETLATQSELLERLEVIGRERGRRWRSLSQFCSGPPPTAEHRGYIKAYLRLRNTDQFDRDYYLSRNPDVAHLGLESAHALRGARSARRKAAEGHSGGLTVRHSSTRETAAAAGDGSSSSRSEAVASGAPARARRRSEDDARMASPVSELEAHLPETAVVAVATGGDESLLSSAKPLTWHFPRAADGSYRGTEASGDTALIANLEATRAAGAEFLFVPASRRELLKGNPRFRTHVLGHYSRVFDSRGARVSWARMPPTRAGAAPAAFGPRRVDRTGDEQGSIDPRLGQRTPARRRPARMQRVHVLRAGAPPSRRQRGRRCNDDVLRGPARRGVACRQAGGARGHSRRCSSSPHRLGLVRGARAQRVLVVPCHEEFGHTRACIHALTETLPTWFRERSSSSTTPRALETVGDLQQLADATPNVSLLRNDVNSGFIASVNRAVKEAEGEFVVLQQRHDPAPGLAAAAARTVPEKGRRRRRRRATRLPRRAAPGGRRARLPRRLCCEVRVRRPRYPTSRSSPCRARSTTAPAACSTFRRDFFLESGGFDPEYGFGFYEDTDFCFRVRALGRVVLYEPESVIVHVEGASAGTDLTQGAKRFQAVNASLFTDRWQEALAHQHERPAELNREALHQLARRAGTR